MIVFYKIVTNIILIAVIPFLPFIYLFSEKRKANLLPRLGFNTGFKKRQPGEKRIWIHALSVGEVISAVPFVKALKERHNDFNIVFTVSTKTGFDMAEQLFKTGVVFKKEVVPGNIVVGYFPFDFGFCVARISKQIEADAVVLVETDLWPNFLYKMHQDRIPVILINARLSERSLKGYLFFKNFSLLFFSLLTHIMAQSSLDKKRFQAMGVDGEKISVVGNIKFDQPIIDMDLNHIKQMKKCFGIQKGVKVFIAGSTHEGEDKILCKVYKNLKRNFPELLMILAPRDPKQCGKILSYFLSENLNVILMSDMDKTDENSDIILIDTMGELSKLYAVCDVAFIGGSMVRQGGHNPLEPAAFAKPILFGDDMSDFLLVAKMLTDNKGSKIVKSEIQLQQELEIILKDNQLQKYMGNKNFEIFSKNSGSVQKIIKKMEQLNIV